MLRPQVELGQTIEDDRTEPKTRRHPPRAVLAGLPDAMGAERCLLLGRAGCYAIVHLPKARVQDRW